MNRNDFSRFRSFSAQHDSNSVRFFLAKYVFTWLGSFFLHEITHVFDSTAFRPSCLRNTTLTNTLLFSFYFQIYNVGVDLYPFVFLRNLWIIMVFQPLAIWLYGYIPQLSLSPFHFRAKDQSHMYYLPRISCYFSCKKFSWIKPYPLI